MSVARLRRPLPFQLEYDQRFHRPVANAIRPRHNSRAVVEKILRHCGLWEGPLRSRMGLFVTPGEATGVGVQSLTIRDPISTIGYSKGT